MNRRALAIGLLSLVLSGCSSISASSSWVHRSAGGAQLVSSATGQDATTVLPRLIKALIDGRDAALGATLPTERSQLEELYEPTGAPLWIDAAGRPTLNARDALTVLRRVSEEGLDPADYEQDLLTLLMSRVEAAAALEDLARLDVAISAGMLRYLRHVRWGRVDSRTIGFRLETQAVRHDLASLLRAAIVEQRVTALAAGGPPRLAQYDLLRSMLRRYRALAADQSLPVPPLITQAIHPGEVYADAAVVRQELIALGDLPADGPATSEPAVYEGPLVEGIKRFQMRHGLEPDGILGRGTIAALRVPLTWRARQIELALERIRWLPRLGGKRLIVLNIPMFRLWAWDTRRPGESPHFGMDAIVGRASRTETPVLVAEMSEVIFRPYWNVPHSILRNEVLPQIERDPDYLRNEDMEIVRGAGDNATRLDRTDETLSDLKQGVLRVRQRPGPKNALGLIKFVFPNWADVYMHGTPAPALFARARRDFSHGCVRVADPVSLAEWVLEDRPEWTRERILAATTGSQTMSVKLPRSVQVILFYTTALVVPEDGTIRFAEDIYGHDSKLDRALATRRTGQ